MLQQAKRRVPFVSEIVATEIREIEAARGNDFAAALGGANVDNGATNMSAGSASRQNKQRGQKLKVSNAKHRGVPCEVARPEHASGRDEAGAERSR
jgi:hypothetical protein